MQKAKGLSGWVSLLWKERLSNAHSLRVLTSQLKTKSQKDETMMNAHGRYVVPCRELSRACQRRVRDCPRMGIIYAIRGLSALSVSAIWGNAKAWTRGMGKERIPRILFVEAQRTT